MASAHLPHMLAISTSGIVRAVNGVILQLFLLTVTLSAVLLGFIRPQPGAVTVR